ncbi:MAG: PAS domain S-box protein [Promethearchaeia archaeon]
MNNLIKSSNFIEALRDIFNDFYFITDSRYDFKIYEANISVIKKYLGYSENEIIGKSFLSFIHPDDIRETVKILKKGSKPDKELFIRIKNKKEVYLWMLIKTKLFLTENNEKKIVILIKNPEIKKKINQKLGELQEQIKIITSTFPEIRFWKLLSPGSEDDALEKSYNIIQMIIDNIPIYIYWKDKNLNYMGCNIYYAKFLGLNEPSEVLGKKAEELINDLEFIKREKIKEQKVIQEGTPILNKEEQFIDKNGNIKYFFVNMVPLYDDKKEISGVLVFLNDITEKKKAELKLKESEQKYRDLLENSSMGIIEIDLRTKNITYCNPKILELLGYSLEELQNSELLKKIIQPEDFDYVMKPIGKKEIEFKIISKTGETKWLLGEKKYSRKENKLNTLTVWLQDISEKKLYENLIQRINEIFLSFTSDIKQNMISLLDVCATLLNAELLLYSFSGFPNEENKIYILSSKGEFYSYTREEFKKKVFLSEFLKINNDFPQNFLNLQETHFYDTDPFIKKYRLEGCYGKRIFTEDSDINSICVMLRRDPFPIQKDLMILMLISDALEVERKRWISTLSLEMQNRTLNEIYKLKSELISRASHELKTPLISIKGFTDLLLTMHKHKLDEDMYTALCEIKSGSERLEKLIKKLIETSKLEKGTYELKLSKENLAKILEECIKEIKSLLDLRRQKINLNIPNDILINVDKQGIKDVILNLLINAIKYSPKMSNIYINAEKKNDHCIFYIRDEGIGFTEQEKQRIFQQFGKIERYGQGFDVESEGSGLGLYIAKEIIKLHNGKIWMESEGRNKGSTFYFSLPLINKN